MLVNLDASVTAKRSSRKERVSTGPRLIQTGSIPWDWRLPRRKLPQGAARFPSARSLPIPPAGSSRRPATERGNCPTRRPMLRYSQSARHVEQLAASASAASIYTSLWSPAPCAPARFRSPGSGGSISERPIQRAAASFTDLGFSSNRPATTCPKYMMASVARRQRRFCDRSSQAGGHEAGPPPNCPNCQNDAQTCRLLGNVQRLEPSRISPIADITRA